MKTKTSLLLFLVFCGGVIRGQTIPTVQILPDDVVQASIQKIRVTTNQVAVKWTYTLSGAKKVLTFREAYLAGDVRTRVGKLALPANKMAPRPRPFSENYAKWKAAWLTKRTDKVFLASETDANAVFNGLKGQ